MVRAGGRAYAFIRWSGIHAIQGMLGEVGWAFEYNDRLGRFHCFYCGSTDSSPVSGQRPRNTFWFEKCLTLPELIKTMSTITEGRAAFDEVKVFDVAEPHSEVALHTVKLLSAAAPDVISRSGPFEHTREILSRYGVRAVANTRSFNAPFLWYNMLPGRSVPVRKLPIHLLQLRASRAAQTALTQAEIEEQARRIAESDPDVLNAGECAAARTGSKFLLGLAIAVNPTLSVADAGVIAQRLEEAIRAAASNVGQIFIHIEPFEIPD